VPEICNFNNQKYKNLFSQAWSSRFIYMGRSKIRTNILLLFQKQYYIYILISSVIIRLPVVDK